MARWDDRRWTRSTALASLLVIALAAPVGAHPWTQLKNRHPDTPTDCTDATNFECVEWRKSGGLSLDVAVVIDQNLGDMSCITDLRPHIRSAMTAWNNQPARNPHLYEGYSGSDFIYVWREVPPWPYTNAAGYMYFSGISQNANGNWKIDGAHIYFNPQKCWNTDLDFGTGVADIRKVSRHELGHAEGLGHAGDTERSIMRQGATDFFGIQQNDQDGIVSLYGAYP
jgi:hypothetical protein